MVNKIVAISGGFDPLHKGHVALIEQAAQYGRLHIYLNTDDWLKRKKGYVFMPFDDRAVILMSMKGVELVIPVVDDGNTVCETIEMFKPDIFCNGGDRLPENTPEVQLCKKLGIEMKFNVGGEKVESSSNLVKNVKQGEGYDKRNFK